MEVLDLARELVREYGCCVMHPPTARVDQTERQKREGDKATAPWCEEVGVCMCVAFGGDETELSTGGDTLQCPLG